jgi:hypothetical protein
MFSRQAPELTNWVDQVHAALTWVTKLVMTGEEMCWKVPLEALTVVKVPSWAEMDAPLVKVPLRDNATPPRTMAVVLKTPTSPSAIHKKVKLSFIALFFLAKKMQLRGKKYIKPDDWYSQSRKRKSLAVLCRHVVAFLESRCIFFMDNVKDVCEANGFNTRRAYDVLSILKALGLVQHIVSHSGSFLWIGCKGFEKRVDCFKFPGYPCITPGKLTLEFITHSCLFVIVQHRCERLRCKEMLKSLASLHRVDLSDQSTRRRVYDVLNVLSCFPQLIEYAQK